MKNRAVLILLVVSMFPLHFHGQGFGSIVGVVTDATGAAVPSANITATQTTTGFSREAFSNTDGYFVFSSLEPTAYNLTISARGFRTEKESVTLLADQSLTVNVKLVVGATNQTVVVEGNAAQVDTSTSTVKQVVETQRIVGLPLNGRNVAQLILTVPGAVNAPNGGADQGATKTFPSAVTYSANGSRQAQISYQLDGGNYVDEYTNVNQPFPFPDALQEFSVQTSNYSAEYGQNAGAVVNVITKSGTNSLHGDAFEFIRNPVFNAQNYFATPTTRDQIKRNQFGGTIGGPIIRDKTFFFAGYQRTSFRNLVLGSSKIVGQTDITNFLAPPSASCSSCGGPNGKAGVIDPAVAAMLGINPTTGAYLGSSAKFSLYGPIPSGSNPTTPYSKPDVENFDSGMGRLDHSIGQKDRITARYEYDRFTKGPVFNPLQLISYTDATSGIVAQNALLHETHIFSATLINDARFAFSREVSKRGPSGSAANVTAFGTALPFQPVPSAIQGVGVQGGFTFGDNPTGKFTRNNFTWSDDVSWQRGPHDLRIGGSIERSQVDLNNQFNQPGIFGFGTQDDYLFPGKKFATYQLFLAGVLSDGSSAGNGYALQQGAGEFKANRNTFVGVYFQDNFRASRRLTLNLGLRYEPVLPWRDNGNRWAQVNLTAMAANIPSRVYPNAPPGIFFSTANGIPSDPGMPKNALNPMLKAFSPRVGFALDLFGNGQTSIRGGFGIFFDSRVMGMLSNRFVDEWPFSPQFILSTAGNSAPKASSTAGSFSDPLCTQAATQSALKCSGAQAVSYPKFPSPFPAPTNFAYNPPYNQIALTYNPTGVYRVPTTYEWNLTVERQLTQGLIGRLAYVGSRAQNILETQDFNPGAVNSTGKASTGSANLLVNSASGGKFGTNTFSTMQADMNDIGANYNSIQLSLERRVSHGLTVLANYTYSKSLDDLPFGEGVSGFDTGYSALPITDPNRHRFDYGPSSFDHANIFSGSYVYQTPILQNSNSLVRYLLGDYEFAGLVTAVSGRPITVLQGTEISGTGIGNDRGTVISGTNAYSKNSCGGVTAKCVSWMNPAAFQPTQVNGANNPAIFGTFGNVGKNPYRLPNAWGWDVQLSKYFSLTERFKLQLRGEYFNVLNHPNFAPESISTGPVNGTDQISAFDKLNNNAAFGTFRAGQAGDPRVAQLAAKIVF
ncbi:MAG TPA: carboxypeptidase-like regulatory domain-containing protein [Acidobacteriaceae bacterium]